MSTSEILFKDTGLKINFLTSQVLFGQGGQGLPLLNRQNKKLRLRAGVPFVRAQ